MKSRLPQAAVLLVAVGLAPIAFGLKRVISDGLAIDNEAALWSHVLDHERRFQQALQAGTSAEGQLDGE